MMAIGDSLDDCQSQARSAGIARAAAVNAIEALGDTGHMFGRDADSRIAHCKPTFVVTGSPADGDGSTIGGVADRVGDQVAQGAFNFGRCSKQPRGPFELEADFVTPGRECARLVNERLEERLQLDRGFFHRVGCTLERGQEQKVADQSAHGFALTQNRTQVFAS